uniref:DUF4455 domain-containing protein n=1 Tax=Lates calcarifer TaxID=8187 RepID=A0A4W6FKH4_LATCA
MELTHRLTESEAQRTDEIRAVLKKYCYLLEKISFLLPPDVHRLIHTEATMLNQSLLANRRSAARLLLLLQEENLQQESLLRLHWEDCLSRWRRSRVNKVIDRFRSLCSRDEDQQLISVQQMKQTQRDLTEQRQDLINRISSLVPPTCSTALVSDWFNQLSAVNQQIGTCPHFSDVNVNIIRRETGSHSESVCVSVCVFVQTVFTLTPSISCGVVMNRCGRMDCLRWSSVR